jgi:hypothetical protein
VDRALRDGDLLAGADRHLAAAGDVEDELALEDRESLVL